MPTHVIAVFSASFSATLLNLFPCSTIYETPELVLVINLSKRGTSLPFLAILIAEEFEYPKFTRPAVTIFCILLPISNFFSLTAKKLATQMITTIITIIFFVFFIYHVLLFLTALLPARKPCRAVTWQHLISSKNKICKKTFDMNIFCSAEKFISISASKHFRQKQLNLI